MPLKKIILGLHFAKTYIRINLPFIGISWIPVCFKELPVVCCTRFLAKKLAFYRIFGLQKASDFCSNNPGLR